MTGDEERQLLLGWIDARIVELQRAMLNSDVQGSIEATAIARYLHGWALSLDSAYEVGQTAKTERK